MCHWSACAQRYTHCHSKNATTKDPSSCSWRVFGSGEHQTETQDQGVVAKNGQSRWQTLPGMPWMSVSSTAWPPEPIRSTALPDGPWQDLAVDLMRPPPSRHSLLVIVDYCSRFYEVEVMQLATTEKVTDQLADTFNRHGLPVTIMSDNGPQF